MDTAEVGFNAVYHMPDGNVFVLRRYNDAVSSRGTVERATIGTFVNRGSNFADNQGVHVFYNGFWHSIIDGRIRLP